MTKILWLAPTFNHYKARFLNHLAGLDELKLTILSGTGRGSTKGDKELHDSWEFQNIELPVSKNKFGTSPEVRQELSRIFSGYDWVLIPAEKKNLPLFLFAIWLRFRNPKVKLFSYNHPLLKSGEGRSSAIDKLLTRFYYRNLDRVIFYTEQSCMWAVERGLISAKKAFWANNTIDTLEIKKHYSFVFPPEGRDVRILFIGRLIPSKRLDILLKYFSELQILFLEMGKSLKLEIIGDGPQGDMLSRSDLEGHGIIWHGALIEESEIAPVMKRASVVFIPGHSGLSINHAFAYGRPYVTLDSLDHAPEINYLEDKKNGFILKGNERENVETIRDFLLNREQLENYCLQAKRKGEQLSVENWIYQMKSALLNE